MRVSSADSPKCGKSINTVDEHNQPTPRAGVVERRVAWVHKLLYGMGYLSVALTTDMTLTWLLKRYRPDPADAKWNVLVTAGAFAAALVVLTGDHVYRSSEYTGPVWAELAQLQAPLGVYSALGNHDHWESIERSRAAQAQADIPELLNTNMPIGFVWRRGARLWLAGVGELWEDEQKLDQALSEVPPDEPAILLSHNPDYADDMNDS